MTLENVADVKQTVIDTTNGVPGSKTYTTGVRITADMSLNRGYGEVNAVRVVGGTETTTVDPSVAQGAAVGGLAAAAFAPAISTKSPREAYNAIMDRFSNE